MIGGEIDDIDCAVILLNVVDAIQPQSEGVTKHHSVGARVCDDGNGFAPVPMGNLRNGRNHPLG